MEFLFFDNTGKFCLVKFSAKEANFHIDQQLYWDRFPVYALQYDNLH